MKAYDPQKTFLELMENYTGNPDDAYDEFEAGWDAAGDAGIETRTLRQALGIESKEDFMKFELGEITVHDILEKQRKAAASTQPQS